MAAIAEQRARGADGRVHRLAAVAREVFGAELPGQVAGRGDRVELPGIEALHRDRAARRKIHVMGGEHLRGLQPVEFGRDALARNLGDGEPPAASAIHANPAVAPGEFTAASSVSREAGRSAESVIVPGVTTRVDLALDRALGGRRAPDLLADRHRFAHFTSLARYPPTAW